MGSVTDWTEFEGFLAEVMQREHIAGAAVGVSIDGRVVYARGFGLADLASGRPTDPETVFGIASVSKSFAALAVMQLADDGKVDPQAPVTDYLPEFALRGAADSRAIRVHHALSHTTGCPPLRRAQGEFAEFAQHLAYLATYDTPVLGYPGQYLSYCNDTFMLAGAIVERVTGNSFRSAVRDRILAPLRMDRSTYDLDQLAKWANVTTLYNRAPGNGDLAPQPWPELGTYHVGGGIRSTVLDLLRYGDMYWAGGLAPAGGRVVSEAAVLRMRAPVYPVAPGSYYCYAQQITPAHHGVTLVGHGGSLPGVSSRWGYVPERNLSAVVLTNVAGVPAELIWQGLVNVALGLPVDAQRCRPEPTFPVPGSQLDLLTGEYRSDEGGRVVIERSGEGLQAVMDGKVFPLRTTAPDVAGYEHQGQERQVRFMLRGQGEAAWAVFSGLRVFRRAGG